MTLSDFATLSTAISGLAVTASLIYLALQTHQNTKHTKALILQGRAARFSEQRLTLASTELSTAMVASRGGEITPERVRREQSRHIFAAAATSWHESFSQYQSGLLDQDAYKDTVTYVSRLMAQPGSLAEWEHFKTPGTMFSAFVDDIVVKLPMAVRGHQGLD